MVIKQTREAAFRPTSEQSAIFDTILRQPEDVLVEALAGTGKTTTQVQALKKVPRSIGTRGAFAFNKSVADTLTKRMNPDIWCGTIHRRGYGMIAIRYGKKLTMNNSKYFNLIKASSTLGGSMPAAMLYDSVKLSTLIRETYPLFLTESPDDRLARIKKLSTHFGIETYAETPTLMFDAITLGNESILEQGLIDYADMVYAPVALNLPFRKFSLLMVDEVQDTNLSQQEFCLRSAERLVLVGDRHQSIYGFRGADVEAFDRLPHLTKNGCKILPLTVTQRCPKSVVSLAQQLVPAFQAKRNAGEGLIVTDFDPAEIADTCKPGDLILCRINAPLAGLLFELWRSEIKAKIIGRDYAKQIQEVIKNKIGYLSPKTTFLAALEKWHDTELFRLESSGASSESLARVQDIVDLIEFVMRRPEIKNVDQLLKKLDEMFVEEVPNTAVRLSTIHRAKGLEANQVFLLRPELIPHPMAESAWELEQEKNLAYVAATRACERLYICGCTPPAFSL